MPNYRNYGRQYVSDMYEPGEDDRGARDEGYYYQWCSSCKERTEHEDGSCLECERIISESNRNVNLTKKKE